MKLLVQSALIFFGPLMASALESMSRMGGSRPR